jgi:hypothetical protein
LQNSERVRSHLPVTVLRGGAQVNAEAMDYDNLARVLQLKGRIRAVFSAPNAAPAAKAGATSRWAGSAGLGVRQ